MLSDVLNDAELIDVAWDSSLGLLRLTLACLRRDGDGSSLADSPVDLDLTGCEAIGIGHNPGLDHVKPSEYRLDRWIQASDLQTWSFRPEEVRVELNSPQAEEDLLCAYRLEWALGKPVLFSACDTRLVLFLDHSSVLGLPTNNIVFAFGGEIWSASSGGIPLEKATWKRQFANWWKSWEIHWQERKEVPEEDEPVLEDTFIPVAQDPPPDLTYRPPLEPVVELLPSDAPDELIHPIRVWFEALHGCDWKSRAIVQRNLDLTLEDQARWEEDNYKEFFGRWGYARQIDDWWTEGSVGEMSVRGVEHSMPDEEDPATNTESVWTFRLRLRQDRWVICTFSQGWPRFGSAPAKEASEKPWLRDWSAGSIVTKRPQY